VGWGEVTDWFCGIGGCKGRVNSIIIDVNSENNHRCNYMKVFVECKYNVKTCMYTMTVFYEILNINVGTVIKDT